MPTKARTKKPVENIREVPDSELRKQVANMVAETAGAPFALDFRFGAYVLSGHGFDHGGHHKAKPGAIAMRVCIMVRGGGYPVAMFRFNRTTWKKFKHTGDGLFKGLPEPARRKSKKKPKKK